MYFSLWPLPQTSAKFACAALALFLGFSPTTPAHGQGGPPMLTDDPDTPGRNRWEINTAYTQSSTRSEDSVSFPHVDVNYGLGDRMQLKYEVGWLFVRPERQGWISGLDNSLIGVKWRFLGDEDSAFKMSVYPQHEFENATNSVQRGVAEPAANFLLPIEISRSFGRVALVGEVGYQWLHDSPDEWVYGVLGAFQASDNLQLLAEIHGTATSGLNGWDPLINVGLRRNLDDRFKLLASIGTGLTSGAESMRLIAYLGIQLLLGKEKP
jgi:hypothetical protein